MVIFNQTFRADRPVIYPYNWNREKTGVQLFEEMRATQEWVVAATVAQVLSAALWLLFLYVVINGVYHLWIAYRLPLGSRRRNEYGRVLKGEPMLIICFISLSALVCTLFFIIRHDWIRWAFVYAFGFWMCVFAIRRMLLMVKRIK